MLYAKIVDGAVAQYPFNANDVRRENPDVSFPEGPWPERLLQDYGCYPIQVVERPTCDPILQVVLEETPEQVGGVWTQKWLVRDATPEEQQQATQTRIAEYERALDAHLDATAQTKRYDNRITCAVRAGYPGPFQVEGQAFAQWMDQCNALGYQIMADVLAGTRPLPTVEEFLGELPAMVWPT